MLVQLQDLHLIAGFLVLPLRLMFRAKLMEEIKLVTLNVHQWLILLVLDVLILI